jgi:nitrite reductase/ring-hydroxylating ferredoxin subunit
MRYYQLARFIDLHDGFRQLYHIEQHRLLLIQEGGERFLIEATCPHREHPLAVADIEGDALRCPLHGYRFSLSSGSLIQATEELCRGLQRYEIVERGTDLGVML